MNFLNRRALLTTEPPWLFRVTASHSDVTDFLWSLQRQELQQGVVRWLRGKQMPTTEDMFSEFAAVLQFPYYFGGNWAAFDECLADLAWLPAASYVIAILDSADLLANQEGSQLDLFFDVLESVCMEWSKPVASGESWDRPGVPFHVILHSTTEDVARLPPRLQALSDLA
jgi:hypothetical protein